MIFPEHQSFQSGTSGPGWREGAEVSAGLVTALSAVYQPTATSLQVAGRALQALSWP